MKQTIRERAKHLFTGKNKIVFAVLATVFLSTCIGLISVAATAKNDVKNYTAPVNDEIASETFLIGVHLIHKNALTDVSYRIAQASEAEYGQYRIYYKAEDDAWYRLDRISAIGDLEEQNQIAFDEVKQNKIRYQTDAFGRTTNLVTKGGTTLFDLDAPLDPQGYPDLSEIKQFYLELKMKEKKTDLEKAYMEAMEPLFAMIEDEGDVETYSSQMASLISYKKEILEETERHSYVEMVDEVLSMADSARRASVCVQVSGRLDEVAGDLDKIQKEKKESVSADADGKMLYQRAKELIKTAKERIGKTREEYLRKLPNPDDSVIDMIRANYIDKLLKATDRDEGDKCVRRLCAINAIAGDYIENENVERAVLKNEIVPKARKLYKKVLDAGDDAEVARVEYEAVLSAYLLRMSNTNAQKYVLDLIDHMVDLSDSDHESSKQSLQKFAIFLDRTYAQLLCDNFGDESKSQLLTKKEQLTRKWQEALDEEEIALASELRAKIDTVNEQIEQHMKTYMDILKDDDATEKEKVRARAALIEHSSGAVLNALADQICETILDSDSELLEQLKKDMESSQSVIDRYDENTGSVSAGSVSSNSVSSNSVSANSAGKKTVVLNMPEEYNSVFGEGVASEKILNDVGLTLSAQKSVRAYEALAMIDLAAAKGITPKIEAALAAAKEPDSKFAAVVTEMLSNVAYAIATAPAEGMTYEAFTELITEYFGKDVGKLNDEEMTVCIAALAEYDELYTSENARRLVASFVEKNEDNPYLFARCTKQAGYYASLNALAYAMDMRLLTDETGQKVTLQRKQNVYTFAAGEKTCRYNKKDIELTRKIVYDGALYIEEEDAVALFGIGPILLKGQHSGVVCTDEMFERKEALLLLFEEGGEASE